MSGLTGLTLGHYRLLEPLVEGPIAAVYKAYDTHDESVVAIKVVRTNNVVPAVLEQALKGFLHEAELLVHLEHPNIVRATDYGEYQSMPYLVMADLPPKTLEQWLGRPIPWLEAVRLLAPIAHALDYAHQQGVVHKDLQPSNILITSKGQPMLADFGVASLFHSIGAGHLIGPGKGTLDYMAPEQWAGRASAQTNIYSLGVVLFEMATGRKPFPPHTPGAMLPSQAEGPLPRAKSLVLSVPDAVDDVLLRALAKRPEGRFATMGDMAAALDRLAVVSANVPVPTQERSRWETPDGPASIDAAAGRVAAPIGPAPTKRSSMLPWVLGLGGLVVAAALGVALLGDVLTTGRARPIATADVSVSDQLPEPTAIPSAEAATLSAPVEMTDAKGVVMRLVSGGDFVMGMSADVGAAECLKLSSPDWTTYDPSSCADRFAGEESAQTVSLDSFYMDKYEVSNAAYTGCVKEGTCLPPTNRDSAIHPGYFEDARYAAYPVIYVDWNMASAYCAWRGARLPTEAEWEKAARGTDGRKYPWGDSFGQMKVNFCDSQCPEAWKLTTSFDGYVETSPVDEFGAGVSADGILNLGGNVWEWVSDEYVGEISSDAPASSDSAQTEGGLRVARGGSWQDPGWTTLASYRFGFPASHSSSAIGFRCARSE